MKIKTTKEALQSIINEEVSNFLKEKELEAKKENIANKFSKIFTEALEISDPLSKSKIENDVYNFLSKYTVEKKQITESIEEINLKEKIEPNIAVSYAKMFAKKNGYNWDDFRILNKEGDYSIDVSFVDKSTGEHNYITVWYVSPGEYGYNSPYAGKLKRDDSLRVYGEW